MADEVKEVLFNDGEGLVYTDLNNIQRFMRAQAYDLGPLGVGNRITQAGVVKEHAGLLPAIDLCYSAGGGGYMTAGASNRQLVSRAGLIMQCVAAFSEATPTGDDNTVLTYYLEDNEINVTTAVGDLTNPRIDIVCVKLAYESADVADQEARDFKDATTGAVTTQNPFKRRKVKMLSQLVAGTAAATPSEPATPAGYVKLYAITVPANHNTTHDTVTNGRDHRMPSRIQVANQYPFGPGPGVNVESGWATAITSGGLQSSAGAQVVRLFPPITSHHGARLLGVTVFGDLNITTPATVEVVRRLHASTAGGDTDTTLATATVQAPSSALTAFYVSTAAAGLLSAEGPLWASGFRGGPQLGGGTGTVQQTSLCLKVTSGAANQIIRMVRWTFAY